MQTIERAFAVLRALAESDSSAGVSEVARRAGLPKSTVSRILSSLDELGMVERLDDRYVVGLGLAALSRSASAVGSLRDMARPYLFDLAEQFGESVALGVLDGDEMLYVDTAVATGAVQVQDWTGHRFPPHTTSAGLVLMADWSEAHVARYGERDFEVYTTTTVASVTALGDRLEQVRELGVAWTLGEFDEEINGAAAGILDADGRTVGAVNVSGPVYRFPGSDGPNAIEAELVSTCGQIADRLTGLQ